jgi:hypothetical protein
MTMPSPPDELFWYVKPDLRTGWCSPQRTAAISTGQTKRFTDPAARAAMAVALKQSWADGKRPTIVWTAAMDAQLIAWHADAREYRWLRTVGAKTLGVGDLKLRQRMKFLGLAGQGGRPPRKT